MATTDKGIYYPTPSDTIAPLESHFSTLATSVDDALSKTQSGVTAGFTGPATVGNSVTPSAITFPAAFTSTPTIVATIEGSSSGVEGYSISIHTTSTTGFTAKVFKVAGSSSAENGLTINWIAIEG